MTLHHYTVQTGHLTLQARGEVDQKALDLLAPMILMPGTHALPGTAIRLQALEEAAMKRDWETVALYTPAPDDHGHSVEPIHGEKDA